MKSMAIIVVSFFLALIWSVMMRYPTFRSPLERAILEVQGHLLEVSLYGAFPRVMAGSLGRLLGSCGRLSYSLLRPSIAFAIPLLLGILILFGGYQYRPILVGEPVLVWIESEPSTGGVADWTLQVPSSISVEVDGFASADRKYWRLRSQEAGRHALRFVSARGKCEKSLLVAQESVVLSASRRPFGVRWLLSPWEPPLTGKWNLKEVHVDYPSGVLVLGGRFFSWELVFLLAFLGWTTILAFTTRPGNRRLS